MERMNILVACEESQAVCKAFRERGHNAFSCDIQECSGGKPEWHIVGDVLKLLTPEYIQCSDDMPPRLGYEFFTENGQLHFVGGQWDMIIAFPPCTYMTNASAVRMRVKGEIVPERYEKAMEAKEFFLKFYNADCPRIAIENPTPMKLVGLPQYSQAVQPWWFGHPYTKRTCLWLKGLPPLMATELVQEGVTPWVNGGCKDKHGNYRRFQGRNKRDPKNRSKTFPGLARAMAAQWG